MSKRKHPDYKKLFYWAVDEVLSWHHSDICGRQCSCQEAEEDIYRRITEEFGRDPREDE